MLLKIKELEQESVIGIWEMSETKDELMELLDLDPFVTEKVYSFRSEKRRLEYLSIRVLAKEMLHRKKSIRYEESGRPYFEDHSHEISITHTGKYAALMLNESKRCGIDIERISNKVVRVQHKFLSEKELSFVPTNNKTQLALMWAAKEALYKLVDRRVVDFTNEFQIQPFDAYLKGTIVMEDSGDGEFVKRYELSYEVFPEFVLVYVIK